MGGYMSMFKFIFDVFKKDEYVDGWFRFSWKNNISIKTKFFVKLFQQLVLMLS